METANITSFYCDAHVMQVFIVVYAFIFSVCNIIYVPIIVIIIMCEEYNIH